MELLRSCWRDIGFQLPHCRLWVEQRYSDGNFDYDTLNVIRFLRELFLLKLFKEYVNNPLLCYRRLLHYLGLR